MSLESELPLADRKSQSVRLFWQFVRYVLIAGVAFIVDFLVFTLCFSIFGLHYLVAAAFGFTIGLVLNYVICIYWVFGQGRLESRWIEFTFYAVLGVLGLGLTALIMYLTVEYLLFNELAARLFAAAIVLVVNFVARKVLLFQAPSPTVEGAA